ncbi:MAG TPA: hypothetical protein VN203_17775, partial [Candidatus Acidoferrum sp.]|nr:hypothetical protein [Candidatus Acidoferrum sp.]
MRTIWRMGATLGLILGGVAIAQAQDAGSLSGRITFAGTPPPKKKIDATKDKEVCGKTEIYDESLVVGPDKG